MFRFRIDCDEFEVYEQRSWISGAWKLKILCDSFDCKQRTEVNMRRGHQLKQSSDLFRELLVPTPPSMTRETVALTNHRACLVIQFPPSQ